MKRHIALLTVTIATLALVLVGCSEQVATPAPDIATDDGFVSLDDFEARIHELMLQQEATIEVDKAASPAPLPTETLIFEFAFRSIEAINKDAVWSEFTHFKNKPGEGNVGFSVWCLEVHPDNPDPANPTHFNAYAWLDRPTVWPSGLIDVDPYVDPIIPAAERQRAAINDPDNRICSNSFFSDEFQDYNYVFEYDCGPEGRTAQLFTLRVIIPLD